MKTKYRLKAEYSICGDQSLQFLFNNEWYYVPEDDKCYVLGYSLTQESCDKDGSENRNNMVAFINQEHYDLIPFTERYEDIEKYFEEVRLRRELYLEEQIQKKKAYSNFLTSEEAKSQKEAVKNMTDVYL